MAATPLNVRSFIQLQQFSALYYFSI